MDRIIIRRDRTDKSVVAFMPDAETNRGMIMCYAHVGQHSEASIGYYRQNTTPVEQPMCIDAVDLICELERIGYEPKIVQRR